MQKNTNKKEWEKAAKVYSSPHLRKEHIRKPAFLKMLGNVRGKKVLDFGCGDGYYSRLLAKKGARVTGVDFSQPFITLAQQKEEESPLGIQYLRMNVSNLRALKTASYDLAIADFVFVTVGSQAKYKKAISEVSRVLKKSGRILLSKGHPATFNRHDSSKKYSLKYDKEPSYFDSLTPQHIRMEIGNKPVSWTNYHRTLEDFINPWMETGFVLTKIIEPKPSARAVKKYPDFLKGTEVLPYFILFELRKTGS